MLEMKPSEAMRAGAKLRPQAFGVVFDTVNNPFGSCAVGAMVEGFGFFRPGSESREVVAAFRWNNMHTDLISVMQTDTAVMKLVCPHCRFFHLQWVSIIKHLNDAHEWDRKRIAQWLEDQGL